MNVFVCAECTYPSHRLDGCDNPACLANPTLSEAHKESLREAARKHAEEKAAWEARQAFRRSLIKSGFTPAS